MSEAVKGGSEARVWTEYHQKALSKFSFHKPDEAGVEKMRAIRRKVRELAYLMVDTVPKCQERDTAMQALATVMMNANSAIVQEYPIDERDV